MVGDHASTSFRKRKPQVNTSYTQMIPAAVLQPNFDFHMLSKSSMLFILPIEWTFILSFLSNLPLIVNVVRPLAHLFSVPSTPSWPAGSSKICLTYHKRCRRGAADMTKLETLLLPDVQRLHPALRAFCFDPFCPTKSAKHRWVYQESETYQ